MNILRLLFCLLRLHQVNHNNYVCKGCKNKFYLDYDRGIPYYRKLKRGYTLKLCSECNGMDYVVKFNIDVSDIEKDSKIQCPGCGRIKK